MKGRIVSTIAAVCLVATVGQAQKQLQEKHQAKTGRTVAPFGTGAVQYDTGAPADLFRGRSLPTHEVGNLFNSRNGAPLSPGTLYGASFYQTGNTNGAVFLQFFGPLSGTNAPIITNRLLFTVVNGAFQAATFPPVSVGSSFIVALYVPSGNPSLGSVGLVTDSTNGQSFHAVQGSFTAGGWGTIPGENAMMRVTGSVVIPVELLEFEVE